MIATDIATPLTLRGRYDAAWRFFKPCVLKLGNKWFTLGTGHLWWGCEHSTFEEAIREAVNGHG